MYNVKNIYDLMNKEAPFNTAGSFDNVGLLVGDKNREVNKILLCLDVTNEVIGEAVSIGAELIIAHHPVIFDPLKSLDANSMPYKLAKNNLSAICAHTNLDICPSIGVIRALTDKVGLKNLVGFCDDGYYVSKLDKEITGIEFAKMVKKAFPSSTVQYSNMEKTIKKIAICAGSGSGCVACFDDDIDAFLTGELKHDKWLEARFKNIFVAAAGHFDTEQIYMPYVAKYLKENTQNIEIVESENEVNPILVL